MWQTMHFKINLFDAIVAPAMVLANRCFGGFAATPKIYSNNANMKDGKLPWACDDHKSGNANGNMAVSTSPAAGAEMLAVPLIAAASSTVVFFYYALQATAKLAFHGPNFVAALLHSSLPFVVDIPAQRAFPGPASVDPNDCLQGVFAVPPA